MLEKLPKICKRKKMLTYGTLFLKSWSSWSDISSGVLDCIWVGEPVDMQLMVLWELLGKQFGSWWISKEFVAETSM